MKKRASIAFQINFADLEHLTPENKSRLYLFYRQLRKKRKLGQFCKEAFIEKATRRLVEQERKKLSRPQVASPETAESAAPPAPVVHITQLRTEENVKKAPQPVPPLAQPVGETQAAPPLPENQSLAAAPLLGNESPQAASPPPKAGAQTGQTGQHVEHVEHVEPEQPVRSEQAERPEQLKQLKQPDTKKVDLEKLKGLL
ncbi:hypothetical protein ACFFK0_11760 [Paenibacillus chartarius]|uniref:Uncharacterized protein n=1 Tax=Paenibacillus chartarius TaxID=747481 RepID=A0ABV6DKF5_9BACL